MDQDTLHMLHSMLFFLSLTTLFRDFQFGAVRNWILRRRTRMNQNEGMFADFNKL